MKKKRKFTEPYTRTTSVFEDEDGRIWLFASPSHKKEVPARILRECDWKRLLATIHGRVSAGSKHVKKLIKEAECLANRFEAVGLDFDGNMDKKDCAALERLRKAIREIEPLARRAK